MILKRTTTAHMKNFYFIRLMIGFALLFTSLSVFSQGFVPKEYDPIRRLKSVNDVNRSIRFTDLFTYPEVVAPNTDLTTIANLTVTSDNPAVIEANGVTHSFVTFARYIVKGGNVAGTATLTVSIDYEGSVYQNTIDIELAHVMVANDQARVSPEGTVLVDVLANDQPLASLDGVSIEILTSPALGEVTLVDDEGTMKLQYASDTGTPNYSTDAFTYRVADTEGNVSPPAEVDISINFSPYATLIIEYKPAAGQFINKPPFGTPDDASSVLGPPNGTIISLGGFGGYIIVGFEQAIKNDPQNPYGVDFTVRGNAMSNWTEPGAVMVMKDENGNGEADDTWYELAGSEYHFNTAEQVNMTYFNPKYPSAKDVIWSTDKGEEGVLRANTFHRQPYYPQPTIFDNAGADQETYPGKKINIRVDRSNPSFITSNSFTFGYVDNKLVNNNPTVPTNPYFNDENGNSSDGFDIAWAVDENGNPVALDEIHFVKVYNAAQEDAGWLGEASTEVESIAITTPDPNWAPQDYYVQLIGSAPYQVLKGNTYTFEGLLFKNGIPQEATPTWSVDDPSVGTIDANGLFTALETGEVTVQYTADSSLPLATFTVDVVELVDMVLTTNDTEIFINEKTYVHAEGVDQRTGPNRFIYDTYTYSVNEESLATVSDNGIVTGLNAGVVTVTVTSNTDASISKSVDITISEIPAIEMTAGNDQLVYDASTAMARIDLDTLFNVAGGGQIFNSVKSNTNEFLVEATIEDYRYLDLDFNQSAAGSSVISIAASAYGDTTEFPVTVQLLPRSNTVKDKQIVFVNGGQFGGKTGNVQIYYPKDNVTEKLADFEDAESVQDVVTEGQYAYVSAEYDIIKYDLISKTEVAKKYTQDIDPNAADGTGTPGAGLNHSMALYKDYVIATRQNSFSTPEDGYNVRVYNKNDLSLVAKIPVSTQASGVIVVGDSAFVALNGGFMGTSGQLAIIDLVNLELKEEFDFGADGTSIMQMLNKDGTIYILAQDKMLTYDIADRSYALHPLPIGHMDFSSSPLGTAIIDSKLYAKINWGVFPGQNKGFGIVDLTNFTVEENDFIGMNTDPDITSNGYALMASAYDTIDHRFYTIFGQWHGNGIGRIYDVNGAEVGSFNHVEDSPEQMAVSYSIVNQLPYQQQTITEATVLEDETLTIDLDEYFNDDETLSYQVTLGDGSPLPSWIVLDESVLIATPKEGIEEASWPISVTAQDQYNGTVNSEFTLNSVPVDDPPVVANPLESIIVKENSTDNLISLAGVFNDIDSPEELMTFDVIANTNTDLVATSIQGHTLTLNFTGNRFGEANITVEVTSDGKTVSDDFMVRVTQDLAPVVANPISDVEVVENASPFIIDLSEVFNDEDGNEPMTFDVIANTNTDLVATSIQGPTLTLNFAGNSFGEANIAVEVTSDGKTAGDDFVVRVTEGLTPVVANPISDVEVMENSGDVIINVGNVFSDEDSPVETMTYAITGNTNVDLVSASIEGTDLTLSFVDNNFGEADITIEVTSEGKSVIHTFGVIVRENIITGISDELTQLSFYPNPVINELKIKLGDSRTSVIQLANSQGILMLHKRTNATEESIDMHTIPAGVYILTVVNRNGEFRETIIKE